MERIPFNKLAHQHEAEIAEVLQQVLSDDRFVLGQRLSAFEHAYADFCGTAHCIGVGNGHDALTLSMRALGLQAGDEVIVPANTYIATWLAVSNAGCIPVPVEPDPATFNIDPQNIEAGITSRTKAIIPVHLYGNPCDMNEVMAIAARHHIKVIEDNAQAQGATYAWGSASAAKIRLTGSFGDVNATSFYPTKNLGALGDGGAVTTDDDELARRIRMLRNYGFSSSGICDEVGINSRLDEIQAAVLSVKLKKLESWNRERQRLAAVYIESLRGVDDLVLPVTTSGGSHVYHLFVIRTRSRKRLNMHLEKEGIQTMVHYPVPPHLQKAYGSLGHRAGDFPVTEQLANEVLSLPLWVGMKDEQVMRICEEVWRACRS